MDSSTSNIENVLYLFPNQLFYFHTISLVTSYNKIVLLEDPLFFGDNKRVLEFHPYKIVLHRASMTRFAEEISKLSNKARVTIAPYQKNYNKMYSEHLPSSRKINVYKVHDHLLHKRLCSWASSKRVDIQWMENPGFMFTDQDRESYSGAYLFSSFHRWALQRLVLLDVFPKSLDKENRKRATKEDLESLSHVHPMPACKHPKEDTSHIVKAMRDVPEVYKSHPSCDAHFPYPISYKAAKNALNYFVKHKLARFGDLQDFIITKHEHPLLFHSGMSSSINIGIINPKEVLHVVSGQLKHKPTDKNDIEGFVRQLIWREYMLLLYQRNYDKYVHSYENFKRSNVTKLSLHGPWYNMNKTDMLTDNPILHHTIKKAQRWAYMHHIERLMVVLNYLLISGIHPQSIYHWFMTYSIDAYDWVMIPNIYSMGYFSSIGTRKPYVSSSSYLVRMSDVKRDGVWDKKWDALFKKFLVSNKSLFKKTLYANLV